MIKLTLALAGTLLASGWASAQALNFQLDGLAAKAKEKVEIDMDEAKLQQMLSLAGEKEKKDLAKLSGLKNFTMRHYEFAAAGQFSESDLAPLRKQISADPKWARIMSVKDDGESVDILVKSGDGAPGEFLLIATEPKELTIIHTFGTIELAQLQELVTSKIAFGNAAK